MIHLHCLLYEQYNTLPRRSEAIFSNNPVNPPRGQAGESKWLARIKEAPALPTHHSISQSQRRLLRRPLFYAPANLAAEGGIRRRAFVRVRQRVQRLLYPPSPVINCRPTQLDPRPNRPRAQLVDVQRIELLLRPGKVFRKNARLRRGQEFIHRRLRFGNRRQLAPCRAGTPQDAPRDPSQQSHPWRSRLSELILLHQERIQRIQRVGGLAGIQGCLGHEANRIFAKRLVTRSPLEVRARCHKVLPRQRCLSTPHRTARDCGRCHHRSAQPCQR